MISSDTDWFHVCFIDEEDESEEEESEEEESEEEDEEPAGNAKKPVPKVAPRLNKPAPRRQVAEEEEEEER